MGEVPSASAGQLVLATWHHLLDRGSLQDGEPYLAGTAARTLARVSAATAAAFELADGDLVVVSAGAGAVQVPVEVTEGMVDHVVWLPTNSEHSAVRSTLGVDAGALVTLAKAATTLDTSEVTA
jgi:NADH-quinone oxidoreductase subunit G